MSKIRLFFELHGESRFTLRESVGKDDHFATRERAGFRKIEQANVNGEGETTIYYILPGVFREEICKGYDRAFVHSVLLEEGILMPDSEGKPTRPERLPGLGNRRCYVISMKAFQKDG